PATVDPLEFGRSLVELDFAAALGDSDEAGEAGGGRPGAGQPPSVLLQPYVAARSHAPTGSYTELTYNFYLPLALVAAVIALCREYLLASAAAETTAYG